MKTTKKIRRPAAKALAADTETDNKVVLEPKQAAKETAGRKNAAKAKAVIAATKKKAPAKTAKPVVSFREGSKRRWFFDHLTSKTGLTAKQGAEFSGWAEPVALSEIAEVSRITERPLIRSEVDGVRVYRLS